MVEKLSFQLSGKKSNYTDCFHYIDWVSNIKLLFEMETPD